MEEIAARRSRVVQREPEASSQHALQRALHGVGSTKSLPGPLGDGHIDVARRVHHGEGEAGVTMEAAAVAFGLHFAALETHVVELWIDRRFADLPTAQSLIDTLHSAGFRSRVSLLGGYDMTDTGCEQQGAIAS